jgi:glutathione S-transferase
MRPWLALRWAKIDFTEQMMVLGPRGGGVDPAIAAINPSGTVPALKLSDGTLIWDSLAICEWAHEAAPDADLLPSDPVARALARSASAEMHAGFAPLRKDLPMNVRRRKTQHSFSPAAAANVARVDALLSGLRAKFDPQGTGWLFGHRTFVDAFYAPVATRFRTYNITLSKSTQDWCDTVFADADFRAWEAAAISEVWTIPETDEV